MPTSFGNAGAKGEGGTTSPEQAPSHPKSRSAGVIGEIEPHQVPAEQAIDGSVAGGPRLNTHSPAEAEEHAGGPAALDSHSIQSNMVRGVLREDEGGLVFDAFVNGKVPERPVEGDPEIYRLHMGPIASASSTYISASLEQYPMEDRPFMVQHIASSQISLQDEVTVVQRMAEHFVTVRINDRDLDMPPSVNKAA